MLFVVSVFHLMIVYAVYCLCVSLLPMHGVYCLSFFFFFYNVLYFVS